MLDFESADLVPRKVLPKERLEGTVVDELDAERNGFDRNSSAHPIYVEAGYHHDGDGAKGEQTARFIPNITKAGRYRVLVAYPWNANRAAEVPVLIRHADGEARLTLNQKKKPTVRELFEPVGTYRFEAGRSGWVEISNAGTQGYVVIDAVQWLEEKP